MDSTGLERGAVADCYELSNKPDFINGEQILTYWATVGMSNTLYLSGLFSWEYLDNNIVEIMGYVSKYFLLRGLFNNHTFKYNLRATKKSLVMVFNNKWRTDANSFHKFNYHCSSWSSPSSSTARSRHTSADIVESQWCLTTHNFSSFSRHKTVERNIPCMKRFWTSRNYSLSSSWDLLGCDAV